MIERKKIKVYLDTSVISALFDNLNPERKSLTEDFFKEIADFDLFISDITIIEIERTPDTNLRSKMKKAVSQFSVLSSTEEVEWLANQYIHYDAIPENYPEDTYHIAIAVINQIDFLLSWNFKHIVREKTRDIVRMVNTVNKLRQIKIMTPVELL